MLLAETIEKELCPVWIREITKQKIDPFVGLHGGILQEERISTDYADYTD